MKFFLICVLFVFMTAEYLTAARIVSGSGCGTSKKARSSCSTGCGPNRSAGRRIDLSAPESREERKEYLEKKLRKEDPESKKYAEYKQEREMLALEDVHESQRFFQERLNKKNKKKSKKERERNYLLQTESDYLKPVLEKIENFPFADQLKNIYPVIDDIKSGKIKFENCKDRSNARILKKIQNVQKEMLEKYHKEFLRKNF